MNKVGLVTIYSVPNYGSVLQAFATQHVIELLGHECVIINYLYPNKLQGKHFSFLGLIKGIIRRLGIIPHHRKQKILRSFVKNQLHLTKVYPDFNSLNTEDWSDYHLFVAGSDQIWNYRFTKGDNVFLLSFLPDGIKRISIASSFAQIEIPLDMVERYKVELQKFESISVRELNGQSIINGQLHIDKNVFLCLDPTLLLSKDVWLRIFPQKSPIKRNPYILLYILSYAFNPNMNLLDIINYCMNIFPNREILVMSGYSKIKHKVKATNVEGCSISTFIHLFANADLVITSSFHGTAFALNFQRPLLCITPSKQSDDRQSSLLKLLGVENSKVYAGQDVHQINPYYSTEFVKNKLESLRSCSLSWISNALN